MLGREWTIGNTVDDMQVGCLWQGNYLLSVSLSGHINYLDQNDSSKPCRIIKVQKYQPASLLFYV